MSIIDKTFQSILSRYGLVVEEVNQEVIVRRMDNYQSPVDLFFYTGVILSIIGLFSLFFFSILFGVILLFSSIPIYMKAKNVKANENMEKKRTLKIGTEKISIILQNELTEIVREEVAKISYEVEKDQDISVGRIYVLIPDNESEDSFLTYHLLEIFGNDKRYVEDDTEIIAGKIADILNE